MKIKVLTFGIVRDIAGKDQLEIELPEGAKVEELTSRLRQDYPGLNRLKSLMVAVNTQYASESTLLSEKDEVALIPPVSGG